jgi:hypothetical protein
MRCWVFELGVFRRCLGCGFEGVARAGFFAIEKMRAGNHVEAESIDRDSK